MERYRNDEIDIAEEFGAGPRQPLAVAGRRVGRIGMFEGQHQIARHIVIDEDRARPVVIRRRLQANAA